MERNENGRLGDDLLFGAFITPLNSSPQATRRVPNPEQASTDVVRTSAERPNEGYANLYPHARRHAAACHDYSDNCQLNAERAH